LQKHLNRCMVNELLSKEKAITLSHVPLVKLIFLHYFGSNYGCLMVRVMNEEVTWSTLSYSFPRIFQKPASSTACDGERSTSVCGNKTSWKPHKPYKGFSRTRVGGTGSSYQGSHQPDNNLRNKLKFRYN
jgi:hypothetical protein